MNSDDILRMAREADRWVTNQTSDTTYEWKVLRDERFGALVAAAELRRLHAEVESLRADAERYRWLRDKGDSITVCDCASDGEWIPLHPENIDATIDAAMKADRDLGHLRERRVVRGCAESVYRDVQSNYRTGKYPFRDLYSDDDETSEPVYAYFVFIREDD